MKVVVTGSSSGMGLFISEMFLSKGHDVFGLDKSNAIIKNPNYHHFVCDVSKKASLPDIPDVDILINNAGIQNEFFIFR